MKNHITIFGAGNLTRSILNGIYLSDVSHNIDVIDVDKKKRIGLKKVVTKTLDKMKFVT